jgi:hypothetical protein
MARHWWLMPVIPATQEVEIRRIEVCSQTKKSSQDLILKISKSGSSGKVPTQQAQGPVQTPILPKNKTKQIKMFELLEHELQNCQMSCPFLFVLTGQNSLNDNLM